MKRFIPAIALLFVVALSSFTTISTKESAKKFDSIFYSYNPATGQWSEVSVAPGCSGTGFVCFIEYDENDSVIEADAKANALSHTPKTSSYTVDGNNTLAGIQPVQVSVRSNP